MSSQTSWLVCAWWRAQSYFLYTLGVVCLSIFMVWTYRHKREYTIDHRTKTYTFKLLGLRSSQLVIESGLHNIYIRLRKKTCTCVRVASVR